MFRTDGHGNLYILSDNSGVITLKDIPQKTGKLVVVFDGFNKVVKEYPLNNQEEVIINVSKEDVSQIGEGEHIWYVDIISDDGNQTDTIIYRKIIVADKESIW